MRGVIGGKTLRTFLCRLEAGPKEIKSIAYFEREIRPKYSVRNSTGSIITPSSIAGLIGHNSPLITPPKRRVGALGRESTLH